MNAPLHFTTYRIDQRPAVLFAREDTSRWQPSEPLPSRPRAAEPEPETVSDWSQVHRRITELAAERARHERELGRWLLAAERLGVPMRAGYGSLREYAERVVGLNGRQTEERLRVARALAALPLVDRALGSGQLSWSAARELTRVAVPRTEKAWLGWAKGRRCREIEKAVAARRSGDSPTDRPDPSLVKRRLVFEVRAETMALFRDLQAAVRSDIIAADGPEAVDDDALLYEIARRALGGGGDECRASYQVAVTRCDGCGAVSIDAGGERHVVEDEVAEMMACDSQQLGVVDGRERGDEADSPHVGATAPTVDKEAESPAPRTPAPPPPAPRAPQSRRATQTVPPATRRKVMRRDRCRCRVDGCTNHLFLDVHHVQPRAEGGGRDPERLVTLCGRHHRAAHRGSLVIEGSASAGFSFRHADGTPYGGGVRPAAIDIVQQVLSALRHMGFKDRRARALIDTVLQQGAPDTTAAFLQAALRAS